MKFKILVLSLCFLLFATQADAAKTKYTFSVHHWKYLGEDPEGRLWFYISGPLMNEGGDIADVLARVGNTEILLNINCERNMIQCVEGKDKSWHEIPATSVFDYLSKIICPEKKTSIWEKGIKLLKEKRSREKK